MHEHMCAAGDRLLKRYVVAMPDLQEQQLSSQDDALILASDGLWDVLTNQDAAQLIKDIKVWVHRTAKKGKERQDLPASI